MSPPLPPRLHLPQDGAFASCGSAIGHQRVGIWVGERGGSVEPRVLEEGWPLAGPSCGAAGSGHEWSRRQRINRLGPRRRTRTACDGVHVFLKSRRGRRQRAACACDGGPRRRTRAACDGVRPSRGPVGGRVRPVTGSLSPRCSENPVGKGATARPAILGGGPGVP